MNLVAGLSHPLFAWSGGNPTVQRQISGADLTDVGQSQANAPGGYHRDNRTNAKGSEHTLYADTVALYTLAPAGQGAPAPVFTYRGDNEPSPVGDPIAGVRLKMESTKAQFLWDAASKTWLRDAGTMEAKRIGKPSNHHPADGRPTCGGRPDQQADCEDSRDRPQDRGDSSVEYQGQAGLFLGGPTGEIRDPRGALSGIDREDNMGLGGVQPSHEFDGA